MQEATTHMQRNVAASIGSLMLNPTFDGGGCVTPDCGAIGRVRKRKGNITGTCRPMGSLQDGGGPLIIWRGDRRLTPSNPSKLANPWKGSDVNVSPAKERLVVGIRKLETPHH